MEISGASSDVMVLSQFQMTEISHVKGSDNVFADVLSRYLEETGQSYDHLLSDDHDIFGERV